MGTVLGVCSGRRRYLRIERVSSARWVWNPKFCPHVISCRRGQIPSHSLRFFVVFCQLADVAYAAQA